MKIPQCDCGRPTIFGRVCSQCLAQAAENSGGTCADLVEHVMGFWDEPDVDLDLTVPCAMCDRDATHRMGARCPCGAITGPRSLLCGQHTAEMREHFRLSAARTAGICTNCDRRLRYGDTQVEVAYL